MPKSLETYAALLRKWQGSINLVGPKTLDDVWTRHFGDSGQVLDFLPNEPLRVVDFGTGAGFPGMVLAMLRADLDVHLVESDQRKCAFLRTVARETATNVTIHNDRVENLPPLDAHVVTARALAPLDKLLGYARGHLTADGFCIFLKGQNVDAELTDATKCWNFEVESHVSETDRDARVLVIKGLQEIS